MVVETQHAASLQVGYLVDGLSFRAKREIPRMFLLRDLSSLLDTILWPRSPPLNVIASGARQSPPFEEGE